MRFLPVSAFFFVSLFLLGCGQEVPHAPNSNNASDDLSDNGEDLDGSKCSPGPDLSAQLLSQPCSTELRCQRDECRQLCEQSSCLEPQPSVCIGGRKHVCLSEDGSSALGRWIKSDEESCCDVKTPDVSVGPIEIVSQPRAIAPIAQEGSLCFERLDSSDFELVAMVSNRGNVATTVSCLWQWVPVVDTQYSVKGIQGGATEVVEFGGRSSIVLAPGSVEEISLKKWLTPSKACTVVGSLRCWASSPSEQPSYDRRCIRLPDDYISGVPEFLPDDICPEESNESTFLIELSE